MKKTLLLFVLTLAMASFQNTVNAQVVYNGTVSYITTPPTSWDGISADCEITIQGTTRAGGSGVYFTSKLNHLTIKNLKLRQKNISASQIPSSVYTDIVNSANISHECLSWDLYVNNTFVERMGYGGRENIAWARLQGLPDKEGYKQSVIDNGYKLYKNGAISIKNVKMKNISYRVNQAYRDKIAKEIAGVGEKENSNTVKANPAKEGSSTNVSLAMPKDKLDSKNVKTEKVPVKVSTLFMNGTGYTFYDDNGKIIERPINISQPYEVHGGHSYQHPPETGVIRVSFPETKYCNGNTLICWDIIDYNWNRLFNDESIYYIEHFFGDWFFIGYKSCDEYSKHESRHSLYNFSRIKFYNVKSKELVNIKIDIAFERVSLGKMKFHTQYDEVLLLHNHFYDFGVYKPTYSDGKEIKHQYSELMIDKLSGGDNMWKTAICFRPDQNSLYTVYFIDKNDNFKQITVDATEFRRYK